jgi:hypothetical protein
MVEVPFDTLMVRETVPDEFPQVGVLVEIVVPVMMHCFVP